MPPPHWFARFGGHDQGGLMMNHLVAVVLMVIASVDTVTRAGRGLYALVNNAGVGLGGPLIEMKEEDFHFLMNVNLYGPYRVTKAFSPLIVASKGRITTIGSISGILTGSHSGAY